MYFLSVKNEMCWVVINRKRNFGSNKSFTTSSRQVKLFHFFLAPFFPFFKDLICHSMKTNNLFERAVKSVLLDWTCTEMPSGKNAAVHGKCRAVVVQCFANLYFKNRYSIKIFSLRSVLNIF